MALTFYYLITQSIHKYYFLVYVREPSAFYIARRHQRLIGFFKISKKYLYRPYGAKGCNFHSSNGLLPNLNTPGSPSGHMTFTVYYGTFGHMIIQKILKYKKGVLIFYLFISNKNKVMVEYM